MIVVLVSCLLATLAFVQKGIIKTVKASPEIHQGDLILTGNNVTTIEGRFDINGSIMVEENATLILRNAILNITHPGGIFLQNPVNGNPRLRAEDTIIVKAYISRFYGNGSVVFSNCSASGYYYLYDETNVTILDSTINYLQARGSPRVSFFNSTIENLDLVTLSANSSISNLTPGLFDFWDFWLNCSVVSLFGKAPNVTLMQTTVQKWSFSFQASSNAKIIKSEIWSLHENSLSHAAVYNSTILYMELYVSAVVELTNSTFSSLSFHNQAKVYVSWYLDVHVIDSVGQDVPSAFVRTFYPSEPGLIIVSGFTDTQGLARLTLPEKMINATGEYPVGNYTVEATYDLYSDETSVNMTENRQITLTLEDFIIPEFPSLLILPLFMIAIFLAVFVSRRRNKI